MKLIFCPFIWFIYALILSFVRVKLTFQIFYVLVFFPKFCSHYTTIIIAVTLLFRSFFREAHLSNADPTPIRSSRRWLRAFWPSWIRDLLSEGRFSFPFLISLFRGFGFFQIRNGWIRIFFGDLKILTAFAHFRDLRINFFYLFWKVYLRVIWFWWVPS